MTKKELVKEVKKVIHNRMDRYHCGQIPGIKTDLLDEISRIDPNSKPTT